MVVKSAIAIIQARMSSTRLPGKVMLPLGGKPMISQIVERALQCKNVAKVMVATSDHESDDVLAEYCTTKKISIYRGSLENVLSRYTSILDKYPHDYVVRITGDCPLIHAPFIDFQIETLNKYNGDIIIARKEYALLAGQGVFSQRALRIVENNSSDPIDLEHVGSKYFIKHANKFRYVRINVPEIFDKHDIRLTVDEYEDYNFLDSLLSKKWKSDPANLLDIIEWLNNSNNKKFIGNLKVKESDINKEIKTQKELFNQDIVGCENWEIN